MPIHGLETFGFTVSGSSFTCLAHSLFRSGNISLEVGNEFLHPNKIVGPESGLWSVVPAVLAWPMQVCSQLLQHGTCFMGSAGNNSRILGLACFYMSSTVVIFLMGA